MKSNGAHRLLLSQWAAFIQIAVGGCLYSKIHAEADEVRSVLHYFAQSPFFDATSNNATLTTQATYNPSMLYLIQTREVFENRLRTMQGLEFMVAYEPKQPTDQEPSTSAGDPSVIWVIRKQNRRKRSGYEDEVSVISSYFIIGENVYMSPSVGNVIGSRLVRRPASEIALCA